MKTHVKAETRQVDAPKALMKAIVYRGPGKPSWEDMPRPRLAAPTDAIVQVTTTTICGTDLHIFKGDLPEVQKGRIVGHEGIGTVVEKGDGVAGFKVGDKVLISCITSCARCPSCRKGMYSHCEKGGWILGNKIDGTQADYVRIPHADGSLYKIPLGFDEAGLAMLSDILPTGYEAGVLNGRVAPGSTVAVVGAGPVGLAVLLTAQFYSPAMIIMVDPDQNRVQAARSMGATHGISAGDQSVAPKVMDLTGGVGVDVAIEAVGGVASFLLCQDIVAPGGTIANIGVHGQSVELHLEKLWSRNISITMKLVDTSATPLLLKAVESKRLKPESLITHRFGFEDLLKAYDTFSNAGREKALKVAIARDRDRVGPGHGTRG
jgi:alcohol dehydrogenase